MLKIEMTEYWLVNSTVSLIFTKLFLEEGLIMELEVLELRDAIVSLILELTSNLDELLEGYNSIHL